MNLLTTILPVVVLYKQKVTDSISLIALNKYLDQVHTELDVFIYDNSPEKQYEDDFTWKNLHLHYKHDPANSGVSKAYNTGAQLGRELGKKFVLLLDQDTFFPDNFIDSYLKAITENPTIKIFAPIVKTNNGHILSPCKYYLKTGHWPKDMHAGLINVNKYSPINSGMLIGISAFFQVGGYNENVRLDFADFQFIERFKKIYSAFYVLDIICTQDFSGFDTDIKKLEHRFVLFCESAQNCVREIFTDNIIYLYVVFKRALSLTFKTRKTSFLRIFIYNYLFAK